MLNGAGVWRFRAFFAENRQTPTALPLLFSEPFAETGLLGAWEITESPTELFAGLLPDELTEAHSLPHPQKRLEFAASRTLLRCLTELVGLSYRGLVKNDFGKPALRGSDWHLSLAHDERHAAAVLHPTRPVGIDLEAPREALRRVAPRILSPAELAHANGDLHRLAVYWTAKEALYKLHGKRGLFFSTQLQIAPFDALGNPFAGFIQTPSTFLSCRILTRRLPGVVLSVGVVE